MKLFIAVSFFVYNLFALEISYFDASVANGKTALVTFEKEAGIEYKGISFKKKVFPAVSDPKDQKSVFVLIPMSYYEKLGHKDLELQYLKNGKKVFQPLDLKVIAGNYTSETIHVDSSKVNPKSKEVKERIAKEYSHAMKVYNTITPELYINKPFIVPMQSFVTSAFGKARVYNGSLKGYHSGTDFRAKVGTPIKAANDGKVVLVADRFYSGGTVVIDHGEGIYTCYFHMSKFDVKEGQRVSRGEIVGLSGKSGRVTGPHLHFAVRINGVQVDPLQLVALWNDKILKGQK